MDLTSKNLQKKRPSQRYRPPLVLRNWRNPFQMALILIAVLSFVGSGIYERIRDRRVYEEYFSRAEALAEQAAELEERISATLEERAVLLEDVLLKTKSEEELSLDKHLEDLSNRLDACFLYVNECFASIPPRYQDDYEVRNWFVQFARRTIEFALDRKEYEQARLWFNAAHVRIFMMDFRPRVEGRGRLEIHGGSEIYEVSVFPLKSDGPLMVLCDPLSKSNEFPLEVEDLEKGSYLVWTTFQDGRFCPYPVELEHAADCRLELVVPDEIPAGMTYIPAGPFYCGGEASPIYRLRRSELPAYYIRQKEVTVGEYLEFWKSLDDPESRDACMSRIRFDEESAPVDAWDADGNLTDPRLSLDFPVVGIAHAAATEYCAWLSNKLGRTVRLPTADEWEKAARGVDGRTYPWGYEYEADANLALVSDNTRAKDQYPLWAPPGSIRRDVSVYTVYDMGGNVREMTSTIMPGSGAEFQVKGGSAFTPSSWLASAFVSTGTGVPCDVGFRYVMEWTGEKQ